MKKRALFWSGGIALCIFAAVIGYVIAAGPTESNAQVDKAVVAADNDFGFRLFKGLAKLDSDKNVFILPPSLALALSMTYNGARGRTEIDMAKVLGISGIDLDRLNSASSALVQNLNAPGPGVNLAAANSLWANEGVDLVPDFQRNTRDFYHAQVKNLDFDSPGAMGIINGWIRDNTQGKLDNVVKDIRGSILLLINTVYFKGTWQYQFDSAKTADAPFILAGRSTKTVPFMTQHGNFKYLSSEDFEAINLPYGNGRLSMYIFLPHPQSSLSRFYKKLNANNWQNWMLQFSDTECDISLPKFKLQYRAEKNLKNALKEQGMGLAFTPRADFTGMVRGNAWIDKVIHQTFVEVNEEGTEAAAATVVQMTKVAISTGFKMVINRPFFYAIRDNKTGVIIFMGAVVEP